MWARSPLVTGNIEFPAQDLDLRGPDGASGSFQAASLSPWHISDCTGDVHEDKHWESLRLVSEVMMFVLDQGVLTSRHEYLRLDSSLLGVGYCAF